MNLYLVKRNEFPHDCCARGENLEEALKHYQTERPGENPYNINFVMADGPFYDIVGKCEAEIGGLFLEVSTLTRVVGEFIDLELGINRHKKSPSDLEGLCYEITAQIETIESKFARAKEFLDIVISRADLEE